MKEKHFIATLTEELVVESTSGTVIRNSNSTQWFDVQLKDWTVNEGDALYVEFSHLNQETGLTMHAGPFQLIYNAPLRRYVALLPPEVVSEPGVWNYSLELRFDYQGDEYCSITSAINSMSVTDSIILATKSGQYTKEAEFLTAVQIFAELYRMMHNGYCATRAILAWDEKIVYGKDELVFCPTADERESLLRSLCDENTAPPYKDDGYLNSEFWEIAVNLDGKPGFYFLNDEVSKDIGSQMTNIAEDKIIPSFPPPEDGGIAISRNGLIVKLHSVDSRFTAETIYNLNGAKGDKGDKGEKGERGEGFYISKTYSSVEEMNASFETDDVPLFGFVLINTGNVEDEENARLYIKGETEYQFLTDLSGAQGIKGEKGDQGIQGVQGAQGIQGVQGLQGIQGEKGDQGIQGVQGPQGIQGEKGDKGDQGDSGILVSLSSGIFMLEVDSDGNLFVVSNDETKSPSFEYNQETGDLYYIIN